MNCTNRDFDEVFILKSLINREFFRIIDIVYDSTEAGQPYDVGHRCCFWRCMWIILCEEKERTVVGAVLSLIFCYIDKCKKSKGKKQGKSVR